MSKAGRIKEKLESHIAEMAEHPSMFAFHPTDFSRKRDLPFAVLIKTIIGMAGKTLNKELFDYGIDVTTSAFVQQRDKLSHEAFRFLLKEFADGIAPEKLYEGYRILAVDGSDVASPRNKDSAYAFQTTEKSRKGNDVKGYNLIHMNAMYDVLNKTYLDAIINRDERAGAIRMIDQYDGQIGRAHV